MRRFRFAALALAALPSLAWAADPYSHAQPHVVQVRHLSLDLTLDFAKQQLDGQAILDLAWRDPKASILVLDTQSLAIRAVSALDRQGHRHPLRYNLGPQDSQLGQALTIHAAGHPARVEIDYATAATASGLQWLTPAQTAVHKQPFMFSQSEAIHARSWVPLQDTPAVRFSYDAHIHVPRGIRVLMSAPNDAKHPLNGDFRFHQSKPIAAYLLAIAAGDIAARATGPRSAVYAEPGTTDRAAREFADTDKMIKTAERLYGPYRWGRYDLLVLPPSFPYGGMENPNMTFMTPTVIVGDKSLVSVVSHELAHSWSGNLVTNASWRDGWLNEGFTTYVQGRLTEVIYGQRQANEEALLMMRELKRDIGKLPPDQQKLAPPPATGRGDINQNLSQLDYTKGAWFLYWLEQRYGRVAFDTYLRDYFNHFAFQSITTEQMLAYLKSRLVQRHPGKASWTQIEQWVYGTGIPADAPWPQSPRFDAIDEARKALLAGDLPPGRLDAHDWNTQEWMYFLDGLPAKLPMSLLKDLDINWHLTGCPNDEIAVRWYLRAIASGDEAAWPAARDYMLRVGRLILTVPVYQAFAATPQGLAYAKAVYTSHKNGYHPLTQQAIERVLFSASKS